MNLLNEKNVSALNRGALRQRYALSDKNNVYVAQQNVKYLSFLSNDYLGLSQHPAVKEAAMAAVTRYGVSLCSSAVLNGYTQIHEQLEIELAAFLQTEKVLLCSNGYLANLAVLSTLIGRKDHVFIDRDCHASLIDGVLLQRVAYHRYDRNDLNGLREKIAACPAGKKWLITDGVFSMTGEIADLTTLYQIALDYQMQIIIDDAHGIGVLGANGRGTLEHLNLIPNGKWIITGTFSKTFGSMGGFIAGDHRLIDAVIQTARPYICDTGLAPVHAAASLQALNIIQNDNKLRRQLEQNIAYFKAKNHNSHFQWFASDTAIQVCIIPNHLILDEIFEYLFQQGIWVGRIKSPTVPPLKSRIRLSLNAQHSPANLDYLFACLSEIAHVN